MAGEAHLHRMRILETPFSCDRCFCPVRNGDVALMGEASVTAGYGYAPETIVVIGRNFRLLCPKCLD
ncbi:hypothetical protein LCGC14_0325970 [marine sediment metagenome]|uniref:Uncharacterized protein n=1 Tax=marine sediment metagenome TaxID=412755 RepID=A0A0F9W562_9ZZZZ